MWVMGDVYYQRLWPTVDHLDPPDLPRHGCNSDRGPAASGGPTVWRTIATAGGSG